MSNLTDALIAAKLVGGSGGSGGGSGSGAPFIVNVTLSGASTATVDKSFAEIADAYDKGVVYFNFQNRNGVVSKVTNNGVTSYQANINVILNMSGWKLMDAAISVFEDNVAFTMHSFKLTVSS